LFAFRRPAQYFFIRRETAFRAAADIRDRRRRAGVAPDSVNAPAAGRPRRVPVDDERRCGKLRINEATSS